MAQPTQQFTLRGQGFQGLNTEMNPIGSDPTYALVADNVVVDRVGRMASRQAFSKHVSGFWPTADSMRHETINVSAHYTPSPDGRGFKPNPLCTVTSFFTGGNSQIDGDGWGDTLFGIGEFNNDNFGTPEYGSTQLAWVDDDQIKLCSIPRDGAIKEDGLKTSLYVHFKKDVYVFSKGNPPLKYNGNGGYSKLSDMPDYAPPTGADGNDMTLTGELNGDVAISAYGRLWVSGVDGDYQTIHYSSLLREDLWYDGQGVAADGQNTGGLINVSEYWPVGFDEIVNIHAHNGFLIVFGRRSIIVYANADSGDPAGENGIQLQDGISNVGLVERDAICNIGTDVMFCDDTGVRSFGRTIQEKSNPIGEASMNVKRAITDMIISEANSEAYVRGIRMSYIPSSSLFVCLFASNKTAYAFSTERPSSTGGLKVTRWTDCYWNAACFVEDGEIGTTLLGGDLDKGILKYEGFNGYEKFKMDFESMALSTGSVIQNTIPKSIVYLLGADAIPADAKAKWGFGSYCDYTRDFRITPTGTNEWGIVKFGVDEYVGGRPGVITTKINTLGAGEHLRVGLEITIDRCPYALQEIAINTAVGRLVA